MDQQPQEDNAHQPPEQPPEEPDEDIEDIEELVRPTDTQTVQANVIHVDIDTNDTAEPRVKRQRTPAPEDDDRRTAQNRTTSDNTGRQRMWIQPAISAAEVDRMIQLLRQMTINVNLRHWTPSTGSQWTGLCD